MIVAEASGRGFDGAPMSESRNKVGGSFSIAFDFSVDVDALAIRLTVGAFDPVDIGATNDFERMGFGVGIGVVDICFVGEE